MKKILLLTSLLILSGCFKEKVCESYDDFYGIKIGCEISDFKDNKNIVLRYKDDSGYKSYEIKSLAGTFYDGTIATFEKPNENQIYNVVLVKNFYRSKSLEENKEEATKLLNDLEENWGLIDNKQEIIDSFDIDPSTIDYRNHDEVRATINSPKAEYIKKISAVLGMNPSNGKEYSILIIAETN